MTNSLSLSSLNLKNDKPLKDYTTFRLGGSCRGIIACETQNELIHAVRTLQNAKKRFILIGSGSNLVVSDKGIDAYVVRYVTTNPLINQNNHTITVSGSTLLDDLSLFCINNSLSGLVFTSGIPGTVGGAIVGNAGAFGEQVGDAISTVKVLTSKGEIQTVDKNYLNFSYRDSKLKRSNDIVIEATFVLCNGTSSDLLKKRTEILTTRHEKHPNLQTHPCAGSFFRNVEPTSKAQRRQAAGWFLEQAGGKTLIFGGARIFDKHANIIVKDKSGTAQDVYHLHNSMKKIVLDKFQIELIREVRFVGQFDEMPNNIEDIIW